MSVLDHLGRNLYSNIPAVLSEVVANAWDADATIVNVEIDRISQVITISDNGCGMDQDDMNERFLTVGFRRRDPQKPGERKQVLTTGLGRHVMGRKGIGKLSLFAIAQTIEVRSAKHLTESGRPVVRKAGCILRTEDIENRMKSGAGDYYPTPIGPDSITLTRGTQLIIRDLNRQATITTSLALRKRLARRFSVLGAQDQFIVKVDGEEISLDDRDYYEKIEYLWSIGSVGDQYEVLCKGAKKKNRLGGTVDLIQGYTVLGWVGTFDERKSIEEGNNSISVLAWGKLVQEDILTDAEMGGVFTKYVMGELRADFVDDDDQPDIATSDRQRLKENDPRYSLLMSYVKNDVLREIERNWRDWRGEDALDKARENDAVKDWYDSLGQG